MWIKALRRLQGNCELTDVWYSRYNLAVLQQG
jgi:hypothetical protein